MSDQVRAFIIVVVESAFAAAVVAALVLLGASHQELQDRVEFLETRLVQGPEAEAPESPSTGPEKNPWAKMDRTLEEDKKRLEGQLQTVMDQLNASIKSPRSK